MTPNKKNRRYIDVVTNTNKYTQVYGNVDVVIPPTCFGYSCGHPNGGVAETYWRYYCVYSIFS
jgi:hypothetical protein